MFKLIEETDDNNVFESLTQNDSFLILMGAQVINVQQTVHLLYVICTN